MKAVVLHEADAMRVEQRPMPEPGPGEVLKISVASICGTDVKVLHSTLMGQPAGEFVMGHEYAGTGIERHADAGYPEAVAAARHHGLDLPGITT